MEQQKTRRAPTRPARPPVDPAPSGSMIRMTTGMEGPGVSWLPKQDLTIGVDIDEAEAGRLVDAGYAERI